jgi:hypothetical protein
VRVSIKKNPEFNIRLYDKNSESDKKKFPPSNSEYFFSNIGNQNIYVWRDGLWYKLHMCNIKGKMYNVILNLYNNIKSRIVYNDSVSNVFPCLSGVRQGENYPVSVRIISK